MDKTSIMLGLLIGRRIAGQRKAEEKTPVAYLYNGVKLPKLPEWDEKEYPYARIGVYNSTYRLIVSSVASTIGASGKLVMSTGSVYIIEDNCWVTGSKSYSSHDIIWSNYDMYYSDDAEEVGGTLYLAASNPIPVYE